MRVRQMIDGGALERRSQALSPMLPAEYLFDDTLPPESSTDVPSGGKEPGAIAIDASPRQHPRLATFLEFLPAGRKDTRFELRLLGEDAVIPRRNLCGRLLEIFDGP